MIMKKTLTLIYGISLALCVSSSAWAADTGRSGQLPSIDMKFVNNAMEGGRTEVQLGQMASEKATSPMVREFGQRMAVDHQKGNEELNRILTEKGITIPASTTKTTRMSDRLQNLNGADFDRAYMKDAVKDHKKDLAEFKNEAANGRDPEIRTFAAQTVPVLEEHLQMAQQAQANLPK